MKKTKLNQAHYTLKGKMVDFFGWDLPVQYSGVNAEHMAVRTYGGLFDVSGNLIGITTFLMRDAQNLNFAIAAEQYWQ